MVVVAGVGLTPGPELRVLRNMDAMKCVYILRAVNSGSEEFTVVFLPGLPQDCGCNTWSWSYTSDLNCQY